MTVQGLLGLSQFSGPWVLRGMSRFSGQVVSLTRNPLCLVPKQAFFLEHIYQPTAEMKGRFRILPSPGFESQTCRIDVKFATTRPLGGMHHNAQTKIEEFWNDSSNSIKELQSSCMIDSIEEVGDWRTIPMIPSNSRTLALAVSNSQ
ncbi:hypothetical protein TNCV_2217711 [Trichonephila clavipes]|nr:hypothetical protein TNCV_2217711 [Trichonephila clavipes]